jgi:hypothetical protein
MNNDDCVTAMNLLGAGERDEGPVLYDHPVPLRRDKYGAYWCPVCVDACSPPGTPKCPYCGQQLDWSSWNTNLTEAELDVHRKKGCDRPHHRRCPGCRHAKAWAGDFRPIPYTDVANYEGESMKISPSRSR